MKKLHEFDQVFDSQNMFRLVLEAMSNPGRILDISESAEKITGEYQSMIALGMTLLDNNVSCCCCGNSSMEAELMELTLCRSAAAENADFIFAQTPEQIRQAVAEAKGGTAEDPHQSALLIIQSGNEENGKKAVIKLSGPGIKDELTVKVSKEIEKVLDLREERGFEFPQGLDFLFVDSKGHMLALPRMIRKEAV